MKHNEFVTKKHKKTCKTLNYVELLFLASTFTDWVLISVFTSIVDIIVEITRSKVGLIVCVMGVGIKKYKSIIKKNKNKNNNKKKKNRKKHKIVFYQNLK